MPPSIPLSERATAQSHITVPVSQDQVNDYYPVRMDEMVMPRNGSTKPFHDIFSLPPAVTSDMKLSALYEDFNQKHPRKGSKNGDYPPAKVYLSDAWK